MKTTNTNKKVMSFDELEKRADFLLDYEENASEEVAAAFRLYYSVDENSAEEEIYKVWKGIEPLKKSLKEEPVKKSTIKKFMYVNPNKKEYKLLTLQASNIDILKKEDIVAFRMDKKIIEFMNKHFISYSEDNAELDAEKLNFTNNLDYCTVENIDRKNGKVTLKSELTGAIFYIYADNLQNEKKNKRCVSDEGIPFVIFSKIA